MRSPHVNVPNSSEITPSLHKKYIYGNHNPIPAYSIWKNDALETEEERGGDLAANRMERDERENLLLTLGEFHHYIWWLSRCDGLSPMAFFFYLPVQIWFTSWSNLTPSIQPVLAPFQWNNEGVVNTHTHFVSLFIAYCRLFDNFPGRTEAWCITYESKHQPIEVCNLQTFSIIHQFLSHNVMLYYDCCEIFFIFDASKFEPSFSRENKVQSL
jgi:hypothetical protein